MDTTTQVFVLQKGLKLTDFFAQLREEICVLQDALISDEQDPGTIHGAAIRVFKRVDHMRDLATNIVENTSGDHR